MHDDQPRLCSLHAALAWRILAFFDLDSLETLIHPNAADSDVSEFRDAVDWVRDVCFFPIEDLWTSFTFNDLAAAVDRACSYALLVLHPHHAHALRARANFELENNLSVQ